MFKQMYFHIQIFSFILLLVFFILFAGCSGNQVNNSKLSKKNNDTDSLPKYSRAVEQLGKNLAATIKLKVPENQKKTFYIYNNDKLENGYETELSMRFIDDLIDELVNNNIILKRKEKLSFSTVTHNSEFKPDCDIILDLYQSDYFIAFSMDECTERYNCIEVRAQGIANDSDIILFVKKEKFGLYDKTKDLYNKLVKIPLHKGEKFNPYKNYRAAALEILGRFNCKVTSFIKNHREILFSVHQTNNTPIKVTKALQDAVVNYGLKSIASEKFFDIVISNKNKFSIDDKDQLNDNKLKVPDIIVAVDYNQVNSESAIINTALLSYKPVKIFYKGIHQTLKRGEYILECSETVYVVSKLDSLMDWINFLIGQLENKWNNRLAYNKILVKKFKDQQNQATKFSQEIKQLVLNRLTKKRQLIPILSRPTDSQPFYYLNGSYLKEGNNIEIKSMLESSKDDNIIASESIKIPLDLINPDSLLPQSDEMTKLCQKLNTQSDLKIELFMQKQDINRGEDIIFSIKTNQPSYVYLFNRSPQNAIFQIFPNDFSRQYSTVNNNIITIPDGKNDMFKFVADGDFGDEFLIAYAFKKQIDINKHIPGIKRLKNGINKINLPLDKIHQIFKDFADKGYSVSCDVKTVKTSSSF